MNFFRLNQLFTAKIDILDRDKKDALEAAGEFLSPKINYLLLKFDKCQETKLAAQRKKDVIQLYSGLSVVVRAHSNGIGHITQC